MTTPNDHVALNGQWTIIRKFEEGEVYVSISGRYDDDGIAQFTFAVRRSNEQRFIPTSELPAASRLIDEAMAFIIECMSTPPAWASGLPVTCEAKYAQTYGEC